MKTPIENQIAIELDDVLRQADGAQQTADTLHRQYEAQQNIASGLADRAQKLRMSLFTLAGEGRKGPGDANIANTERTHELRELAQS